MDNTLAISTIVNGSITDKTKHINISYKIIKELYKDGVIKVSYLETDKMEADLLTKPLSRFRTIELMEIIGLMEIDGEGRRKARMGSAMITEKDGKKKTRSSVQPGEREC